MAIGYDGKLYILAFDHRGSFQKKMFGIEGDPTPEEIETIADAKRLIFEGVLEAEHLLLEGPAVVEGEEVQLAVVTECHLLPPVAWVLGAA